jgi:hypothetical protein
MNWLLYLTQVVQMSDVMCQRASSLHDARCILPGNCKWRFCEYGLPKQSILYQQIYGDMGVHIPSLSDRQKVYDWIRNGAPITNRL